MPVLERKIGVWSHALPKAMSTPIFQPSAMEEGFLWSPTLPQIFPECLVEVYREELLSGVVAS